MPKLFAYLFLTVVSLLSFGYSAYVVRTQGDELILQIYGYAQSLAYPLRLAQLISEPPLEKLPVPVLGIAAGEIDNNWGTPRSGDRSHEGIDIFADRGTSVFSVSRGYVVRVGFGELGGNYVFIMGPGGVRYYYAHLDRVADGMRVGAEVTPDTVLGYVGDTGNARGTPTHLHFGMYDRGAQNPYELFFDR